jgi:hypothetical protein
MSNLNLQEKCHKSKHGWGEKGSNIRVAVLFGAPNNSGIAFDPNLDVDHIMAGNKSMKITNLQFLTGAQNKEKYFRWKSTKMPHVSRKD